MQNYHKSTLQNSCIKITSKMVCEGRKKKESKAKRWRPVSDRSCQRYI